MEEDGGVELEKIWMDPQPVDLVCESQEVFVMALLAIVIAEDVVDLGFRKPLEKGFQPGEGRVQGGLFITYFTPAEIKGVSVEDEEVGVCDLFGEVFDELVTL